MCLNIHVARSACAALCPDNLDARVGLGFTLLLSGQPRRADTLFGEVLAQDAMNSDAWEGRARAAFRLADAGRTVWAGRRALELTPNNEELPSGSFGTGGFAPWRWNGWTEPRYHGRLQPVYDSLRQLWRVAETAAPSAAPAPPGRPAPSN